MTAVAGTDDVTAVDEPGTGGETTAAVDPVDTTWHEPGSSGPVPVAGLVADCRNTTGPVGGAGSPGNKLSSISSSATGVTVCPWGPSTK